MKRTTRSRDIKRQFQDNNDNNNTYNKLHHVQPCFCRNKVLKSFLKLSKTTASSFSHKQSAGKKSSGDDIRSERKNTYKKNKNKRKSSRHTAEMKGPHRPNSLKTQEAWDTLKNFATGDKQQSRTFKKKLSLVHLDREQ